MLAMAHREVTGVPVERYINGVVELQARAPGPDTLLVIFDDVAGSGQSLAHAVLRIQATPYQGQVIVSPMVSTELATKLFNDPASGGRTWGPKVSFQPRQIAHGLDESALYRGLDGPQQDKFKAIVGDKGYGGNGLSMAFPYMAPDNNNSLFGHLFAKFFIANRNRRAAKSPAYTPPSQRH